MHYTQQQGIKGVTLDDIYLGNGASELIVMATNALLNDGDELLLPAPDYPLWTARCQPVGRHAGALPAATRPTAGCPTWTTSARKITPRTKGIVVINPNNPTGALYSDELLREIVDIAREHGLVILADEVYDKVLYDGARAHRHRQPGRRRAARSPSTRCPRATAPAATAPAGWWSRATRRCAATTSRA